MTETAVALPGKEQFMEQLNSTFDIDFGDVGVVPCVLQQFTPGISNKVQDSFSLIFRAPADVPRLQRIYRMVNASLGEMELFLVPVKQDDEGLYFEAVFNHLLV
jgi:hypothetical protein